MKISTLVLSIVTTWFSLCFLTLRILALIMVAFGLGMFVGATLEKHYRETRSNYFSRTAPRLSD
jgi:hypothetical protein